MEVVEQAISIYDMACFELTKRQRLVGISGINKTEIRCIGSSSDTVKQLKQKVALG